MAWQMIGQFPFLASAVLATALAATPLGAQTPATPNKADVPTLTMAELDARRAAMETDAGIESVLKDKLRATYQQAAERLQAAAADAARAASYLQALETAPVKTAELQAQLAKLPATPNAVDRPAEASAEQLQQEVETRRAALAQLQGELAKTKTEWTRVKGRPFEVSDRLPEAQRELADLRARLASPRFANEQLSPGRWTERTLLEATQVRLVAELEMLAKEQQSQLSREGLLQARRDLLTRQVANAAATLEALTTALNRRLTAEVRKAVSDARSALEETGVDDPQLRGLVAEVEALGREFQQVINQLRRVTQEQEEVTAALALFTREDQLIREQLKLGRAGGVMAQRLYDFRQRLPSRQRLADRVHLRLEDLGEARLAALDVEEKLWKQEEVAQQWADRPDDIAAQLLAAREALLTKLEVQYGALIRSVSALATDERQYWEAVRVIHDSLSEKLFWTQSSPPIGLATVTQIPADLWALFGPPVAAEFGRALLVAVVGAPLRSGALLLAALGLLVSRRRLGADLVRTADLVRNVGTDNYGHTARALLDTVLLALPLPLLLVFVGWALGQATDARPWLQASSFAWARSAWLTLAFLFLAALCRREGLGTAHFGWRVESAAALRKSTIWLGVVYIPALLITRITGFSDEANHIDSLGRICFMAAHLWAAMVFWRLLRPADGVLTPFMQRRPFSLVTRLRYAWFGLAIGAPLALVVCAALGYLLTAFLLSLELLFTGAIVASGVILCWLTLRWFMIHERRLAQTRGMGESSVQPPAAAPGEMATVRPTSPTPDLSVIGEQTRRLLEFLFGMGTVIGIGLLWSGTLPIFSILGQIRVAGAFSLLDLGQAVLIVAVTATAARNLPGLIELATSSRQPIDRGTRVAMITLCQYALVVVGLALLWHVLHIDWAKFGWIAAALSVGLGFGLQEVVANFVCGLILLFERPVRVGDIVTVEGMTGTVSRIRMRATTILNWDRQEFVVPNKTFVTGTILNWTLSNPVTRITLAVGVAYGSDTDQARQLMLDAAAAHPLVLKDPPPFATFEEFADSSLTLRLRVYLPNLENRLKTVTELNTDIARRFAAAGIVIAFPQRDLHIRSWPGKRADGSELPRSDSQ